MFQVPVTFYYDFLNAGAANDTRRYIMREFAANGAKHLVLSNCLLSAILGNYELAGILRREMQDYGLTFVDAHAPYGPWLDLNVKDPAKREIMLSMQKTVLLIAADMGVNTITIHVGNNCPEKKYPVREHLDCIKRSLDELLPLAEKLGITICIENIWFAMNQPAQLLEIKAAFPTNALGFCYDSGHANLMAQKNSYVPLFWNIYCTEDQIPWDHEILEKMLPHVVNCHLHDNDRTSDFHRNIGQGNTDWKHIIGLLRKAPRLKCIQSEVLIFNTKTSIREVCTAFDKLGEL